MPRCFWNALAVCIYAYIKAYYLLGYKICISQSSPYKSVFFILICTHAIMLKYSTVYIVLNVYYQGMFYLWMM